MNRFAPVLIPTLNRHVHFKRCVESLSVCTHADKTDLFILLDYPLKDAHWEGYELIKAYLPNIKGFKTINVIEREKNYGVNDNLFNAMNYVYKRYDSLIISEDDNVFAPSFLKFVNYGLSIYEHRPDIFSISGCNDPFPMPDWYKHDAYLITAFCAWGVGIWRDKWNKVDWSLDSFNSMLSKKENFKKLKENYQRYLPQLLKIRDTGVITGDGLLFLYLLQNKMYSIYPTKTRVRNTGHDGSGVNCGNGGTIYLNQKVYEGLKDPHFPFDLQPDPKLIKYKLKQVQLSLIEKFKLQIPPTIRIALKKYLRR